ncbi:GNAT family N-acetyltransferase [Candidatus Saccharibacteria bacterium]|nr:GNAT family N-acetyltransferase [Candidatus Saccharibacteria bacterium]
MTNKSQIIVKEATLDDLKAVQDLSHQLFEHDVPFEPALNMNWSYEESGRKFFVNAISDDDKCCFVAFNDEEIVGYLAGSVKPGQDYEKGTVAELDNTLVLDEYRGLGVGRKLFDEFKIWAKSKKVDRLYVSAYFDNSDAVAFYHAVGFKNYGWSLKMEVNNDEES